MAKTFIETTTPCPNCKVRGLIITDIKTDCNEDDIRTRYFIMCPSCDAQFLAVNYISPVDIKRWG